MTIDSHWHVLWLIGILSGCGLVLNVDPHPKDAPDSSLPDAPPSDAPPFDAPPADAIPTDADSPPDAVMVDVAPTDAPGVECSLNIGDLMVGPLPDTWSDGCSTITWTATGATRGTPSVSMPFSGEPGPNRLDLRADDGPTGETKLVIDFGRPVSNVRFSFDYLTANGAARDERLAIEVDGAAVTPVLSAPPFTYVSMDEVHSTGTRGEGTIDVARVQRLGLVVRNYSTGNGEGVEFYDFRYSVP